MNMGLIGGLKGWRDTCHISCFFCGVVYEKPEDRYDRSKHVPVECRVCHVMLSEWEMFDKYKHALHCVMNSKK
jgi:hypothetical protein